MAISPLTLIKKGAAAIAKDGKAALTKVETTAKKAVAPQTVLGIAKNIVTGIPTATKDLVTGTGSFKANSTAGIVRNTVTGLPAAARDILAPTRGYTEKQLAAAKPTLKQTAQGIPKVVAEFASGLSSLPGLIPGYDKKAQAITNTKVGKILADTGEAITKYGKPKNVEEAKAMRFGDVVQFLPVGSLKAVGVDAKLLESLPKELRPVATALTKHGSAEEILKTSRPKAVKDIVRSGGTPVYHDTSTAGIEGILEDGFIKPNLAYKQKAPVVSVGRDFDNFSRYKDSPYRLVIDERAVGEKGKPFNLSSFDVKSGEAETTFTRPISTNAVKSLAINISNPGIEKDLISGKLSEIFKKAEAKGLQVEFFNGRNISPVNEHFYENARKSFTDLHAKVTASGAPAKTVSEVDRAIADGKVRVVSRDGKETYQYKKADKWVTAPTDEDAVVRSKRFEAGEPVTNRKVTVDPEVQQLRDAISATEDAVSDMPGKQLMKYVSRETGELPELSGKGGKFSKEGDSIYQDLAGQEVSGGGDVVKAQEQVDQYRAAKARVDEMKQAERELRASKKAAADAKKAVPPIARSEAEVQTLEKTAQQALSEVPPELQKDISSLPAIVEKVGTSVKEKVNLLDYLRTPDRVLQKIGLGNEATKLREGYDAFVKELPKNINKITAWSKRVPEKGASKRIFQYLDGKDVTLTGEEAKVASEIKSWLSQWADRLNLPDDNRIASYITHIFDKELKGQEFDEDLAKLITDRVPGSVYNPFLEKRLGAKGYKEDVFAALDAYTKRATRKVHMDPALEVLQNKAGKSADWTMLEESQFRYVKRYIDRVNMRPTEFDNLMDNGLKRIIGYKLGQRPSMAILKTMRRLTSRALLGINPGSALRNLSQGINTYAVLGEKYTAIGYAKLFYPSAHAELNAEGILADTLIQDRNINAVKKSMERFDKALYSVFQGAERINRGAAYFGAKAKYIAEHTRKVDGVEVMPQDIMDKATAYAKEVVRKTQFVFDDVDTPVALGSEIAKTLAQFKTYSIKQVEFLAELHQDKTKLQALAAYTRYSAAGLAFVFTVGKAFGMKPSELIPSFRFDTPPSLKLPVELAKAALNTPDKYGKERSVGQKAKDIGTAALGYVPGSAQAKKTLQGIEAAKGGGSFDKAGKLQFEVATPAQKVQAVLFGKYSSKNAKGYFDKMDGAPTDAEKAIVPIYNRVQELKAEGKPDDAVTLYDGLTDAEKTVYKAYRTSIVKQETAAGTKAIVPTFQQIRALKDSGKTDEAVAAYDALSDDQKKYYQLVKKQTDRDAAAADGTKPTYDDGEVQTTTSVIKTVATYAKALGVDPVQAFRAMFTKEKLNYVNGNVVTVQRIPAFEDGGSQDIAEKLAADQGVDRSTMRLDHTVPLELGGTNSESNLRLITKAQWASYTPIENLLGTAIRDKKISRSLGQKLIKQFKNGEITADQVKAQVP